MSRLVRNFSAAVFLVAAALTQSVDLRGQQTCAQVGWMGIGPGCAGPGCWECIEYGCFAYAAGDQSCYVDCILGAWYHC